MQWVPIDGDRFQKMSKMELIRSSVPYHPNKGEELLRTGAILEAYKTTQSYHGDFKEVMKKEFGIKASRGFLLMRAWRERDSYLKALPLHTLNYKVLESILRIPRQYRMAFIQQEHPENNTARNNQQLVKRWKLQLARERKEEEVWE